MESRNSSRHRNDREIHYQAPEVDRWTHRSHSPTVYDYYLVPVARPRLDYQRDSTSELTIFNDQRLRPRKVATRPPICMIPIDIPTTSTVEEPPESWHPDPRIRKNPSILKQLTKMPRQSEVGPSSFHYLYSFPPTSTSELDKIHAPLTPMNQKQPDPPAPIQKWPKVTNLNQISASSPPKTYRLQKWPEHMISESMVSPERPPTRRSLNSEQLIWTDLNQIPLPIDPNEIF